jgi:hypothetical protein
VAAHATLRATAEGLSAIRQQLRPPGVDTPGSPLPASVLKHLDEQTVAALAAAYQAIEQHGLAQTCFAEWAVLAAPRFLGRTALAHTLQRYALEGAWGMSPHVIPHRTLHAVSGTLSLALQIHGPNFGIDGGPGGACQTLLAALAMLSTDQVPGVWVVLTGWDREPIPERPRTPGVDTPGSPCENGHPHPAPVCGAVALALVATRPGWTGPRLRLRPGTASRHNGQTNGRAPALFSLEALLATLGDGSRPLARNGWRISGGGSVEITEN